MFAFPGPLYVLSQRIKVVNVAVGLLDTTIIVWLIAGLRQADVNKWQYGGKNKIHTIDFEHNGMHSNDFDTISPVFTMLGLIFESN